MKYLVQYANELFILLNDMAPWLLLGFLIAGILHVFFPDGKIRKILGSTNTKSVINAALIGIPLPLCSCGVIPTGVSFYKNGASRGAASSFMISTPQTGVDSIMVTYSLLGLPFAILRPIVAFITGIVGGLTTNLVLKNSNPGSPSVAPSKIAIKERHHPIFRIFNYAFVTFLKDIAKWLVIGLMVAGLIAVFVPDDFFANKVKNEFLGMLIILVASIPIYVCATSSVPIAAVLMIKGLSPGAALVFLMAGPATNAATMTVIGKVMGKKTLITYVTVLAAGALFFGFIMNNLLPREWFISAIQNIHEEHEHGLLPEWLKIGSGIVLILLLLNSFFGSYFTRKKSSEKRNKKSLDMNETKIKVKGMTCNHCKMNVENAINSVNGIKSSNADFRSGQVIINGENYTIEDLRNAIEKVGYTLDT